MTLQGTKVERLRVSFGVKPDSVELLKGGMAAKEASFVPERGESKAQLAKAELRLDAALTERQPIKTDRKMQLTNFLRLKGHLLLL